METTTYSVFVDADGDLCAQDGTVLRAATQAEIEEGALTAEGYVDVPPDVRDRLTLGDDGVTREAEAAR